jgi:hypothetical protein
MRVMHRDAEAERDMTTALSLADVEVETFAREYCVSPAMYKLAMSLFDVAKEAWTEELREKRLRMEH